MSVKQQHCAGRKAAGFSLIEVTIAIGIAAYTLLALLGLYAVGLNASRDSAIEIRLAEIAQDATARIRAGDTSGPPWHYSQEGARLSAAQDAYFDVTVDPAAANPPFITIMEIRCPLRTEQFYFSNPP